jgi:hypothetical protein
LGVTGRAALGYGKGRHEAPDPPRFRGRPCSPDAAAATICAPCRPRRRREKPALAATIPTTDELLTPPPIAQPQRQDDGLARSQERKDDRFDMPPT